MPADRRFHERIARIEKGKTWVPDGVVRTTPAEARARRQARKNRLFYAFLTLVLAPVGLVLAGPLLLPDPVRDFFSADSTEAAMASLSEIEIFSRIGDE